MNRLPLPVTQLAARLKTHGALHNAHEPHNLKTLATRLLVSKGETLEHIRAGRLLPVAGPMNGKYLFPSGHLDALRNGVVAFIAQSICTELSRRGADEETMLRATERAFRRQVDLARGRDERLIEFAQDDDDSFLGSAKKSAGTVAGLAGAGAAGYLGYKAYQNLRNGRNKAAGMPKLPGSSPDDDDLDPSPKGPRESGGASITSAAETAASDAADGDLLGAAVRTGRNVIGRVGGAIWDALKFAPAL